MLQGEDYARSEGFWHEDLLLYISADNIFPEKWTKVSKKPSNAYLEGDFYIVYVEDRMFVLFLLLPFTVILPTLYNSMIAVFIFCCYDKKELCSGINNLEQMINEIQNITSD